ncbi:MAG: DNA polymerase [Nitrospirae bacterium]|nr:DNA polymerase [Nitrospirota bacterium]
MKTKIDFRILNPLRTHIAPIASPEGSGHWENKHSILSSPLHHFAENPTKIVPNGGEDCFPEPSPAFTTSPSDSPAFTFPLGPSQYRFQIWVPAYGKVLAGPFALDTETTLIEKDRPTRTPTLILGVAFNGTQGWFIAAKDMPAFLATHPTNQLILHNAVFDLAVIQAALNPPGTDFYNDIYNRVLAGRVADTLIMARLIVLATQGHSAINQCSLDYCANLYLGLTLPKDTKAPDGALIRETFHRFLGKPVQEIPPAYLQYAAGDSVATWCLYQHIKTLLPDIKDQAPAAFGYAGSKWLDDQWKKYGPLTHDIQLKASIVLDVISRNGVLIDQDRRDEKAASLQKIVDETRSTLALASLPVDGKGSQAALRKRIEKLAKADPNIQIHRTEKGHVATNEEQLKELAACDPVLEVMLQYRQASKLLGTYAKKMMPGQRIHGKFNYLMNSGRTSCGGGFNLQNLPKEEPPKKEKQAPMHDQEVEETPEEQVEKKPKNTIRGCFVPPPGNVFVVVDYKTLELTVLGWAWKHQLKFGDSLHTIIQNDGDMHRLIAAKVLDKEPEDISRDERNATKPVSLGRPGGLGWRTIQKQVKDEFGVEFTEAQVRERMQTYEDLCPELTEHLKSRIDTGLELAIALGLTPAAYNAATGKTSFYPSPEDDQPMGWLGGMLLKTLKWPQPETAGNSDKGTQPRPYTPAEISFFWAAAARLPDDQLDEKAIGDIRERRPSPRLRDAVSRLYGLEPVITATGRIRANASYSACRNGIMQGLAADGAIHALWDLWRAGYKIVNFIHDEIICEVPEDENLPARVAEIERLMIEGMQKVVPGANVRGEPEVRRSFSKADMIQLVPVPPAGAGAGEPEGLGP